MLGRDLFEAALDAPDDFDVGMDVGHALALMDVPPLAYEMRAGKAMKRKTYHSPPLAGADLSEDDCATILPRVAAACG